MQSWRSQKIQKAVASLRSLFVLSALTPKFAAIGMVHPPQRNKGGAEGGGHSRRWVRRGDGGHSECLRIQRIKQSRQQKTARRRFVGKGSRSIT
jgi:hypothetical protein